MSVCVQNYGPDGDFGKTRRCIVPKCESSIIKTPEKLWFEVPTDLDMRMIWLNHAFGDAKKLPISKRLMYFCEDHFDLEKDMENYEQYSTMGPVERVRLKPGCVPTRFDYQTNKKQLTTSHQDSQYMVYAPNMQPASPAVETDTPILLTLLTEDNCNSLISEDATDTARLTTLFCICCLVRDVSFVRLITCCHAEFLNDMVLPEIKPKNQVICHQCHNTLKKIKKFKLQVEESFKLLSESTENIPKTSYQNRNYKIHQNVSINIQDANRQKKPVTYNAQIPHTTRIKPNIRLAHVIKEEETEAKDKRGKGPTPKSSILKYKPTKNIEDALKIINSNQNNAGVNLLANSLQSISTTLLKDIIYPNFPLGSQFGAALSDKVNISGNNAPSCNITATTTENIVDVKEENDFKTNNAETTANSIENIVDVKEENDFKIHNAVSTANSIENITVVRKENELEDESINSENIAHIKVQNEFETESINYTANPTENIADVKVENECQVDTTNMDMVNTTNLAFSTELAKILEENALKTEPKNIGINSAISPGCLIENIKEEKAFQTNILGENESNNTAINSASPTENKEAFTVSADVKNLANSTENGEKKKSSKPYSVHDHIEFVPVIRTDIPNSNNSLEELANNNKEDSSILHDLVGKTVSFGKNVAGEELNETVTEKKDSSDVVPHKKEKSFGGRESNIQPFATPTDKSQILGGNVRQLTLTRKQLMDERAKAASSPVYLRAPHKCETCIIGFQFYENLEDHFNRKHTRGKRLAIQCVVCRQIVDSGANYDMHMFWHHTRYQCVACEQLFASYDKAAVHYKKQHPKTHCSKIKKGAILKCPRCAYKTGRKRLMRDHMSLCSSCKHCGAIVGGRGIDLEGHVKIETPLEE